MERYTAPSSATAGGGAFFYSQIEVPVRPQIQACPTDSLQRTPAHALGGWAAWVASLYLRRRKGSLCALFCHASKNDPRHPICHCLVPFKIRNKIFQKTLYIYLRLTLRNRLMPLRLEVPPDHSPLPVLRAFHAIAEFLWLNWSTP